MSRGDIKLRRSFDQSVDEAGSPTCIGMDRGTMQQIRLDERSISPSSGNRTPRALFPTEAVLGAANQRVRSWVRRVPKFGPYIGNVRSQLSKVRASPKYAEGTRFAVRRPRWLSHGRRLRNSS